VLDFIKPNKKHHRAVGRKASAVPCSPAPAMASTIAASANETRKAAAIHGSAPIGRDPMGQFGEPLSSDARAAHVGVSLTGLLLRLEQTL